MLLARRRGLDQALWLEYFTVGWNTLEAVVAIAAGMAAGSIALVGFGLDSVVETSSGAVLIWRLQRERVGRGAAEEVEGKAIRGVAIAFLALASYVAGQGAYDLWTGNRPEPSLAGIVLAAVSLAVMPALALRKRAAARALDSRSLRADSTQTALCAWLSAALLLGLGANALLGWWWADPVAGLAIAVFAAREAVELWRTKEFCCP